MLLFHRKIIEGKNFLQISFLFQRIRSPWFGFYLDLLVYKCSRQLGLSLAFFFQIFRAFHCFFSFAFWWFSITFALLICLWNSKASTRNKNFPSKTVHVYHTVNWFRDLMTKFLTSKIICASGRENLYSQLWNLRVKLSTQYSEYVTQRYQGWTSNENNMDHREHIKDPELLAWRLLCNLLT